VPESQAAAFSLVTGGLPYRAARALRLVRGDGQYDWWFPVLLVALVWVPLMVLGILERKITGQPVPLLAGYGVHARLLVAIPLFFGAESSLHMRSQRCIDRFIAGGWAAEGEAAVARLTGRAARWRDAITPEIIMLAVGMLGSQAVLQGMGASIDVVRGPQLASRWSPSAVWYGFVALPIYQFLAYRWLWRWGLWSWVLWKLSRLHLRPMATHPDLQGGLGFLSEPAAGFAFVLLGLNFVQAAVWGDRVLFAHVSVTSFKGPLALLLVACVAVALGPLLVFARPLWRARFDAIRAYDELATDYTRRFHVRWIVEQRRDDLLGATDIQSLADLGTSYDVIRRMRLVPIGARAVAIVVTVVVIPMIPLVLLEVPLTELVRKLGAIALGGFPG
jgi:hypothetical protein